MTVRMGYLFIFPSKKERDEIDGLKEQILKLQEEIKAKEQRRHRLRLLDRRGYAGLF